MNPQDDRQQGRVGTPAVNQRNRSLLMPERHEDSSRHAAANIIRDKIDEIYSGKGSESTPHTTPAQPQNQTHAPAPQPATPADKPQDTQTQAQTQSQHSLPTETTVEQTPYGSQQPYRPQADAEQWKQYHSAWQKYYQLYYERYYTAQMQHAAKQQGEKGALVSSAAQQTPPTDSSGMSEAAAMRDLRNTIRDRVVSSAKQVRHSRHFIPVLAAIVVMLCVVFLQYNQVVFAAVARYTTPGNADPQNIIVDPTVSVDVTPDPRIIIPKINVDAPVIYGVGADHDSQMKAMEKGAAHFSIPGANAVPGQEGNTVISAHSSNDVFASGDYKFIFAQNERLKKDDVIYANYKGKRYGYTVVKTEVVLPSEVTKVQQKFDKPMLILISCVPLGTAEKRLLVYAEQVSPDPSGASKSSSSGDDSSSKQTSAMPGGSAPTLLERLFGAH